MEKLHWYIVDKKYVNYLKTFDSKIEDIDYKDNLKPYIGIVININEFNYYVPVSSPKDKHYKMKEGIDFIKIKQEGRILGVLNLNNMIPILDECVKKLEYENIGQYRKFKTEKEKKIYIALLNTELKVINSKCKKIKKNTIRLYQEKIENPNSKVSNRCCNFKFLESKLNQFISKRENNE